MKEQPTLNAHNKEEYPPMHTAEHILNQTMIRLFGCSRSRNTHIEKKKSKADYFLPQEPSREEIAEIERLVNETIDRHLPVTASLCRRDELPPQIDLSKLPPEAGETLRIVAVGDYDLCACIGAHVGNTAEIGRFKITTAGYEEGRLRIRFKLEPPAQTS